ncbi:diaminopimelate epimerase [Hypnocyclicus thermotrophus]|uniref:Diaminopimelate epimerase n=1 Tax=Hypnocyclicus thermotrophus TaxID=1627895 RepID=A0AA46E0G3_9FUSO|nr:diaminopimelate epimerase [Hypnocyclicus thermotrophus]TDT72360.1 diaminopimelate epimerase [Hypnocyclicus thermotrophus]
MIKFEKYHGLGNDFIIFLEDDVKKYNYSELAKQVCHRNFGIGADGMIVVAKSTIGDVRMIFFNADGSEAPMCGNGVRCFSHYVRNNNIVSKDIINVETLAGIIKIETSIRNNKFFAKVNMGSPIFTTKNIPMSIDKEDYILQDITSFDKTFKISSLFMGTTHSVIIVDNIENLDIIKYGSDIENNPLFPKKTNVNFVEVIDNKNIIVKTWERGAGFTYACGTGTCASVVMTHKLNKTENKVTAQLPGGILIIEIIDKSVFMTGPSEKIAEGQYFINLAK